ncbi:MULTISPECIES: formate dehydrogenase subunit gamma [Roseibium]|jgi:formate dehydrogenase subunit gamma|uniref:NADP-reducing hydrogenase subunit HndA n=3 Tax=Stappiaceae TaxID=2821832 RepID=A0A0M6XYZ8_9HYPH|nr:formate dehydrogenase subunit gamma [Roseibium aggregatum]MBO9459493.1 formate dehydrogenase subunit gamma [Labrenzia sp. R5_0]MEE2864015.1 formate dehydrogenase subunit gamma [Pseudomonadota bacterium]CTQ43065.1 NADP-reducing hydrogenase subunit HndA [Roseibium aggregatum]
MPYATGEPTAEQISAVMEDFITLEGPLLPMLHGLQAEFGYVPQAAVELIAEALNLSKAEVHGVISFYHDFRKAPAGRHVVKICRAEACQAVGGEALGEAVLAKLGLDWHGTTRNGAVTLEPVYCLGLCACAPAAMVDGKVIGRVTEDRMTRILQEAGA